MKLETDAYNLVHQSSSIFSRCHGEVCSGVHEQHAHADAETRNDFRPRYFHAHNENGNSQWTSHCGCTARRSSTFSIVWVSSNARHAETTLRPFLAYHGHGYRLNRDTMNTASRMESTGLRDKIQVSQETAELLFAGGKSRWVTPREDKVAAKGKGEVREIRLFVI